MYSKYEGLNVGSGQHYAAGWFNIDAIPTDQGIQPDLLVDIFDLPTRVGTKLFKKAYVGHVLEHIDYILLEEAIECIAQTVQAGGEIIFVGPCINKAIETGQPQSLINGIISDPATKDHPWAHSWTPTEELTLQAVMFAGNIENVHVVDIATITKPKWPNPSNARWQTAISGTVTRPTH